MQRLKILVGTTLLLVLFALPAYASEFQDMDICLGRQVIARALCKDPVEINYVSAVRDNINLFSVFYAKKEARFFVGVYKDMIKMQGKDYLTVTRTIPYHFDATAKCGVVEFSPPDCPTTQRIVCCSKKTVEDELDEKFWNRPIPELLEEDLRNALENNNATEDTDEDYEDEAQ